jgi:hypothetical protein
MELRELKARVERPGQMMESFVETVRGVVQLAKSEVRL